MNLFVENRALCDLYPLKQNDCNEMESVLLQAKRIREMQDYIDAQFGGPGKGFFRIVSSPYEARKVINQGKLAVVQGMEVSEPFGCGLKNGSRLRRGDIDLWLDHLHELGVRQLEIVNKFDNALTGVAGDGGTTGTITNSGNFYATGSFWDMETATTPSTTTTRRPRSTTRTTTTCSSPTACRPAPGRDASPVYPSGPLCNTRGLTAAGRARDPRRSSSAG